MVTRLLLAPNRKKFFRHPLNIIDMVSVVPIYITLFFDLVVGSESELGDLGRLIQVLIHPFKECKGGAVLVSYLACHPQVFRLMRIFRVLKLARHSTGLRSLGATLRVSQHSGGLSVFHLVHATSDLLGANQSED